MPSPGLGLGSSVPFYVMLAALAAGCANGVAVPRYDPAAMAHAAMADYDKNGDGKLDAAELEDCPALKSALPLMITEKRDYLTEEDITERLRQFQEGHVGLLGTRCRVTRGEVGVPGVTVTFIPERFMGDVIKPGSGVSNADGYVNVVTGPEELPGLSLGYYRIEVSLKDAAGNETLPAKFNTRSKLGMEVQNTKRAEIVRIDIDS